MSTRNTTTTNVIGQPHGTAFDDKVNIPDLNTTAITHIVVTYDDGSYIRSLTVHYNNKTGEMRGGAGSSQIDVILTPGEFITEVEGNGSAGVLIKIAFRTNKGISLAGGWTQENTDFKYRSPMGTVWDTVGRF